jgi:hypothetical protein
VVALKYRDTLQKKHGIDGRLGRAVFSLCTRICSSIQLHILPEGSDMVAAFRFIALQDELSVAYLQRLWLAC